MADRWRRLKDGMIVQARERSGFDKPEGKVRLTREDGGRHYWTTWATLDRNYERLERATAKITVEQIQKAVEAGLTEAEIAEAFKASPRAVHRAKHRAKIPTAAQRAPIPPEKLDRVRALSDEGMPIPWAAEGLGYTPETFRAHLKPGSPPDWLAVWQQIRHNPTLLDLHYQFAPKKSAKVSA